MSDERTKHFLSNVGGRLEADAAVGGALGRELAILGRLIRDARGSARPVVSEAPPGLRHIGAMLAEARDDRCRDLAEALAPLVGAAYWTRFYAEDDWTRPFLNEFANGEIVGPHGPVYSDRVILGAFVLGPNTLYPPHAHPAVEIYLPLAGYAEFAAGGTGFRAVPPGTYSLHPSNAVHAIRTGNRALLALFAWRGDMTAPSWYLDAHGERQIPPRLG